MPEQRVKKRLPEPSLFPQIGRPFDEEALSRVLACLRSDRWTCSDDIRDGAQIRDEKRTSMKTREMITELIMRGHPIISNSSGYRLATSKAEMDEYIRSLEGRIGGITNRIAALKTTRERMPA